MRFSYFDNAMSRTPEMVEAGWSDFVELLHDASLIERQPTEYQKLYASPLVSPATYAPGALRLKTNVTSLGGWFALDVDDAAALDDVREYLDALATDYVIYTTTKSRPEAERFRVCVPLDREIAPDHFNQFWRGSFAFFGEISDPATKDASRLFTVPAAWVGSSPRFVSRCDGRWLAADAILAAAPPMPPEAFPEASRGFLDDDRRAIPLNDVLPGSEIVSDAILDRYLGLGPGEHHVGLYRFMVSVGMAALSRGYAITADDLIAYARQADALCRHPRERSRWARIRQEAISALEWAENHASYRLKKTYQNNLKRIRKLTE